MPTVYPFILYTLRLSYHTRQSWYTITMARQAYVFDIDGVFNDMDDSSPRQEIIEYVATLLSAGVPVSINTGRNFEWIREMILEKVIPLLKSQHYLDNICVISEFGGNFSTYSDGSFSTRETEFALEEAVKQIARDTFYNSTKFTDSMRENTAKKTLVTFGKRDEVDYSTYKKDQSLLVDTLSEALHGEQAKVNPTTNAVDVHHPDAGKWTGSAMIAAWLTKKRNANPEILCLGDSHIDFDMAGYFSENGYKTTLVFTGPDFKEDHGYNNLKIIRTKRPYYLGAYDYLREAISR